MLKKTLLFIILSFLISKLSAQTADFVAYNGNIWTVDKANPTAEAIASYQGKFIYVGGDEVLSKYSSTNIINVQGLPVYPGFIDSHAHFYDLGFYLNQVDLNSQLNQLKISLVILKLSS